MDRGKLIQQLRSKLGDAAQDLGGDVFRELQGDVLRCPGSLPGRGEFAGIYFFLRRYFASPCPLGRACRRSDSAFVAYHSSTLSAGGKIANPTTCSFGQGTITFKDNFDVIGGLRVDYENKKADLQTFFDPAVAPPTTVVAEVSTSGGLLTVKF